MFPMIRLFLLAVTGLFIAGYGVVHSVGAYPGQAVFDQLSDAMPTIMTVLSFSLGVIAAIAGSMMLTFAAYRLRRRKAQPLYPLDHALDRRAGMPPLGFSPRATSPYRDEEQFERGENVFVEEAEEPDFDPREHGRLNHARWTRSYR